MSINRLFIAEKPELAKAIAGTIGVKSSQQGYIECHNGDVVTWCYGHMLEMTEPHDHNDDFKQWKMEDLPIEWPIDYRPRPDVKKQLSVITSLAAKSKIIVNAGDNDDEGQRLVDEIIEFFEFKQPIKRVLVNDYNEKLVQKALDNIQDNKNFTGLSQAALARAVCDLRYGVNLTRLYTLAAREKGLNSVMSVGRVQTPILGLIIRRELENKSHEKSYFYELSAEFSTQEKIFSARYQINQDKDPTTNNKLNDEQFCKEISEKIKDKQARVKSIKKEIKKESPPLTYNLLKLQSDASKTFNLSPQQTLDITQSLREKHKLITYNRSDCSYLSDEQHLDAENVLNAIEKTATILKDIVKDANPQIKSRAFNSKNVTAHHAIIPTSNTAKFEDLNKNEQNIYLLICRAYIYQFYNKHEYEKIDVIIEIDDFCFSATSKKTTEKGFKKLGKDNNDDEDNELIDLSYLSENDDVSFVKSRIDKKSTTPPPLYKMDTLLSDLTRVAKYIKNPTLKNVLLDRDANKKDESGGIGTSATRGAIIEGLFDRGFIEYKGKSLVGTKLGHEFYSILPSSATSPDMTAIWQQMMIKIQEGSQNLGDLMNHVNSHLEKESQRIKEHGLKIKSNAMTCPKCKKGVLTLRKSKSKSDFFACTKYPECDATYPSKQGKPDLKRRRKSKPRSK